MEFESSLEELFLKAKEKSPKLFEMCFYDIRSSEVLQNALRQAGETKPGRKFILANAEKPIHTLSNIIYMADRTHDSDLETVYLKLYAYLQVVETSFIYRIIGNLLRVAFGSEPREAYLEKCPSGFNKFRTLKRIYDTKKSDDCNLKIFNLWEELINRELRNAIAHNDFWIDLKGKRVELISHAAANFLTLNATKKDSYAFDEVFEYFNKAKAFSEDFKNIFEKHSPYSFGPKY